LFIVHATNGDSGATEHLNSTVIQKSRWSFSARKDYLDFIRTATHEFVHTWNVKSYRPKEMVPYDFQKENYTTLLWIAEGSTSYFDELNTLKSGIQKRDEYLEQLAKSINDYHHTPGNLRMSASEASFDEWIHGGPDKERARNANSGIYTKGELLGLMFDIKLRIATQGKKGWQDVHNVLATKHTLQHGGFSEADVLAALQQVGGRSFAVEWSDFVDGSKVIPFDDLFNAVGLRFEIDVAKDADIKTERWAGINIKEDSDAQRPALISDVEANTAAWQAGLVAGDIIVAINGLRVSSKDFSERLASQKSDVVTISFFRRDELRELQLPLTTRPKGKAKLKAIDNPSKQQKALNEAWLGQAWPEKKS
jgi:predicted metalloprotease with PDZ domain